MAVIVNNNRLIKAFVRDASVQSIWLGDTKIWDTQVYSWAKYGCTFKWNKYNALATTTYTYKIYEAHYEASTTQIQNTITITSLPPYLYEGTSIKWTSEGVPDKSAMTNTGFPTNEGTYSYTNKYVYMPKSMSWSSDLDGTIWYSPTITIGIYSIQKKVSGKQILVNSVAIAQGSYKRTITTTTNYGDTYFDSTNSEYYVKESSSTTYSKGSTQYSDATSSSRNTYPDNGTPDNVYWYVYSTYERGSSPIETIRSDNPDLYPSSGLVGNYYYIRLT